ncbi:MAG: hypothetical protein ACD_79C00332G0010 [uncultured bacterium]|nr:MAG: hypothetical protein ACD_79C00332G0010 [uncultured bacterium]
MYQYILLPFIKYASFLNVFKYITFRVGMAALTSMLISLIIGPWVIKKLQEFKFGQEVRKDESVRLHELHKGKQGTPTMGGVMFTFSVVLSTLFWADINLPYIVIAVTGIILFTLIGFADDYIKIKKKRSKGLTAGQKFLSQAFLALVLGVYLLHFSEITAFASEIFLPFLKGTIIHNSEWFYLLFIVFVITGTSNAVNLTDGLDGLAIGCTIVASLAFTIMCYVVGNKVFCDYLYLEYIRESAELSVFCAAMSGAGLGFLWYNAHPAKVFMGDTGALGIGGALGIVAVLIKKEIYLFIIGGVFVIEALSVILQVGSFKLRKKRIFLCAPFHHHLEFMGWKEPTITVRLWILAIIFAILGLSSLKLR